MIKRLLLSLICIWSLTALSAQTVYPIRSYTILTPPMPYSLSSFAGETGKMQLNINVDDISLDNYPVKFRLFITGNGIRLYTKPNMIQDPYYLFGGMTETLTGLDLAPLFDPNNLIFEGFSKRQYEVEGRLPEGVYQVKVEVWDYHHNINISQAIPGVAVMYLTRAPQLTLPFDNSELDILNNLNIRFSWMGFVPNDPLSNIVYEFKLWEILPDGRSKYEVANSVAPIFTQQTSEAYLVYDMGMPPLQTGRSYAWQVQAVDLDNRARFQNDGYSDVFQFRYGASCPNATISIKEIGNTQATFNISMSKGAQLYRIFYKTEDTEEWQSTETDNRSYTLTNLDENTTYQVKVVCLCGNDESDESSVTTFKTKWDIDYTCGTNLAGVDLSNTEPLAELKRFGLFKAADFTIEVVEVSGSDGHFSGSGFALVPYLGFIKFGVDFDNVFINSDRRMTEGEVKFQFNKDTGLMLDLGSVMAALTPDNDNTITVDPSEAVDQSTDYVIKVDDEISSVVVTDSTVTVVTVGGDSKTYTANPGQTVGVVSPDGKTVYVADTGTGQVYTAPNPNTANTNANSVVSPAQSGEYGVTATFSPASNMRYGYDAVGNGTNKPNTYFNTDKQGNKIAWKSLGNGRADYVDVSINGADPDSIRFLRSSGMLASTIDQGGKKQLLLTGMAGGQEETLTAAFVKTTQVNDSTQNETLTEAGALGLVNYDYLLKTVHLIPVNGAKCPNNAGAVRDLLNQYYGSAVVEWEVRVEKGFETDKINSDGFNTEDKTLLSKYTSDMNTIISQYKKQDSVSINKDHLYLFFVECTTNKQGFMPLTGRYGFIFNFGSNAETIAHELGHGAFNLWHTFSDKGQYKLTEGSTPNLMDYSGGTELWKYQWDLIHNPEKITLAWNIDSDEEAATIYPINPQYRLLFDLVRKYATSAPIPLYSYFDLIDATPENTTSINLTYTDNDACTWSEKDKKWIEEWRIRNKDSDEVLSETKAISAIKETGANQKIGKIILRQKHIYLANYTISDNIYPIAIYGDGETTSLENIFTKRVVSDIDSLADKSNIDFIYCDDALFSDYLIIAFYEKDKSTPTLIIQVLPLENYTFKDIKKEWLKHLGIYRESIDGKTLDEIFNQYESLSAEEISIVRSMIKEETDSEKKKEYYLKLQEKVEYKNQRDNISTTDGASKNNMCNLTSVSMAFEMLGVSKEDFIAKAEQDNMVIPQNIKDGDFEDVLEYIRHEKDLGNRELATTWDKLAKYGGIKTYDIKNVKSSLKSNQPITFLEQKLGEGYGIVMSISNYKGHIVRLQNVSETGVVIDDPFGELYNLAKREFKLVNNSGAYYSNDENMTTSGKKGKDNIITWNEFDVTILEGIGGNEEIKANQIVDQANTETFEDWLLSRGDRCTISEFLTREEVVPVESNTEDEEDLTTNEDKTTDGSNTQINTETLKYYIAKETTIKYYKIYSIDE
nr:fibronectin type III domain-containing protein [uncultured Carboxylicivirga sp.]